MSGESVWIIEYHNGSDQWNPVKGFVFYSLEEWLATKLSKSEFFRAVEYARKDDGGLR